MTVPPSRRPLVVVLGLLLLLGLAPAARAATDYEIAYQERTTDLSVTATSAATGNVVLSETLAFPQADVAYEIVVNIPGKDGSPLMVVDLFVEGVRQGALYGLIPSGLHPLGTAIQRYTPTTTDPLDIEIRAWVNTPTGTIKAGDGTDADAPAFLSIRRTSVAYMTEDDVYDWCVENAETCGAGAGGAGCGDPCTVEGTVSLSPADRERLDLAWYGAWAMVGLMFILILAPRWFAAFRVTHGA